MSSKWNGLCRILAAGTLGWLAAGCQTTPSTPHVADAGEGRQVVQRLCVSCHAIEPGAISPNPAAPPFEIILERYGAGSLATDLENATSISYLKMPTFYLADGHGEDIVAYLKTIQRTRVPLPK